MPKINY